ncbi:hypothetical protein IJH66_00920 [Candidatus Saccharibacteria bacterium]|nr:hypothetical protein [Candidatus Saccharibacteria bacterium]MBQ6605527.1 hypothetical protein [Candidatus Saccharibacteria bacterium]
MSIEARDMMIGTLNEQYRSDITKVIEKMNAGFYPRMSDGFAAQDQIRTEHLASVMAIHHRYATSQAI